MTTEIIHVLGNDGAMHHASGKEGGPPSGLYKIRIPQNAQSWFLVTQTGNLPVECSVVMSIDTPPDAARAVEVGPDYRTVLQRLWASETLRSYTPAHSGVLSVSASERGSWRADRERWVYLQFDFGAYKCLSMQGRIDLHADAIPPAPPPLPEPDLALAHRTLDHAHASGMVKALMKMAGTTDEAKLVQWVLAQGDFWFSLCRMVGLAEASMLDK